MTIDTVPPPRSSFMSSGFFEGPSIVEVFQRLAAEEMSDAIDRRLMREEKEFEIKPFKRTIKF